jgi:hypothetical protein
MPTGRNAAQEYAHACSLHCIKTIQSMYEPQSNPISEPYNPRNVSSCRSPSISAAMSSDHSIIYLNAGFSYLTSNDSGEQTADWRSTLLQAAEVFQLPQQHSCAGMYISKGQES